MYQAPIFEDRCLLFPIIKNSKYYSKNMLYNYIPGCIIIHKSNFERVYPLKVGIVGATGYSGLEVIRILHHHPEVEIKHICSNSLAGREIAAVYPHLSGLLEMELDQVNPETFKDVDVVLFAVPSGVSQNYIPELVKMGIKCIDLSGDFRLKSPDVYKQWYKHTAAEQSFLEKAVYGLSEVHEQEIKNAQILANPGCYPTAALLGLIPALKLGLLDPKSLIIDGKTGVSGAGRGLSLNSHFSEINENMKAYKLGIHQHTPEIEQELSHLSGEDVKVSFSAHLVPITRGILCTIYANVNTAKNTQQMLDVYKEFYHDKPFVRIRPEGVYPATKEVYGTNYCDIGINMDERTGRVTIVSVIDNLVKGAAGQAVQNMNMMFGMDATTGLKAISLFP